MEGLRGRGRGRPHAQQGGAVCVCVCGEGGGEVQVCVQWCGNLDTHTTPNLGTRYLYGILLYK